MKLWDKLTGTQRPADGVVALPPGDVRAALLAVGGGDAPFEVVEGGREHADITGRWRIEEPTWRSILLERDVSDLIEIAMRLHPDEHEVRAVDYTMRVVHERGLLTLRYEKQATRGVSRQASFRGTIGGDGIEKTWSFDTNEMKDPLRDAVTAAGWTWRGVAFGKL